MWSKYFWNGFIILERQYLTTKPESNEYLYARYMYSGSAKRLRYIFLLKLFEQLQQHNDYHNIGSNGKVTQWNK